MNFLLDLLTNAWTWGGLGVGGVLIFLGFSWLLGFGSAVQLLFKVLGDLWDFLKGAWSTSWVAIQDILDTWQTLLFCTVLILGTHFAGVVKNHNDLKQCNKDMIDLTQKYVELKKKYRVPHSDIKTKKVPTIDFRWPWE